MDDKPLDLTKKSASLNKESDLPFTEKREESIEDLRLTPNRSVSYYKKEFSKSMKKNETLEEPVRVESRLSSKTSKRYSITKCGEKIPGSFVSIGRIRSDESANNSLAKGRESFDLTSDIKNEPVPTRLDNPNCSEKASEKCISPRPSTSLGAKCSDDYPKVQGNLTKSNEKSFVCEYCSKVFPNMSAYKEHVRSHTGDKPFACQYCDKRYAKKWNLEVHIRLHTGERPYLCQYCDKKYAYKWHRDVHIRLHTRPYGCQYCDKKYAHKGHLGIHIRVHTGERPYVCQYCGSRFTYVSDLKKHSRIHTGENLTNAASAVGISNIENL